MLKIKLDKVCGDIYPVPKPYQVKKVMPKWVDTPLRHDYEDSYWYDLNSDEDEKFLEAVTRLEGLNNKYRKYSQYCDAMETYEEYIPVIVEHYGGQVVVDAMIKAGEIPTGWRQPPKMKKTKSNKFFVENKIRVPELDPMSDETVDEMVSSLRKQIPLTEEQLMEMPIKLAKPTAKIKAMLNSDMVSKRQADRLASMYKESNSSNYDIVESYFRTVNSVENEEAEIELNPEKILINKYLEENKSDTVDEISPEDAGKTSLMNDWCVVTRRKNEEADIVALLHEQGIECLDPKNLSAEEKAIFRQKLGAEYFMSKKELKKARKKKKEYEKYHKREVKRSESQREIMKALTRNDVDVILDHTDLTLADKLLRRRK